MHKYELVCILNPDLDETAANGVLEKVSGWITDAGGSIEKKDVWGRRKLAYIINKHRDGQYVLFTLSMPAPATVAFERNLRLTEAIIRHLTIRVD